MKRPDSLPDGWAFIYVITDPRAPDRVRYVGKSDTIFPYEKLGHHMCTATRPNNNRYHTQLGAWVREIMGEGVQPDLHAIEWCESHVLEDRERFHIHAHRRDGHDLLNAQNNPKAKPIGRIVPSAETWEIGHQLEFGT